MKTAYQSIVALLLAAAAVAWSPLALATDVAVVNPGRLLQESPQAQAARARLQSEFAGRRQELQQMQEELVAAAKQLQQDQAVLSEEELAKRQAEVREMQREFQQQQQAYNDAVARREREEFEQMRQQIYDVIVAVAEDEGFDLVLSDGIVYAADDIDITDEVLDQLQQ